MASPESGLYLSTIRAEWHTSDCPRMADDISDKPTATSRKGRDRMAEIAFRHGVADTLAVVDLLAYWTRLARRNHEHDLARAYADAWYVLMTLVRTS